MICRLMDEWHNFNLLAVRRAWKTQHEVEWYRVDWTILVATGNVGPWRFASGGTG